ncbi:MAG: 23S rRNA (adenine(1618)-N(6))-methyltransferase RlmF [Oceanospirillales bacterium]|nr:23S rRNA (adenine(1618)-N(6))-methyltransferase RlmF [Oceanospirillales bacterium]
MRPRRHTEKSPNQPDRKGLHPSNLHAHGYDFPALINSYPPLAQYVSQNAYGNLSIDFADPLAVKALNAALLKQHYNIVDWDIPEGALCPPIPGRADYIHYIADLPGLNATHITLLDIGTGANGIYPLLACQLYGWQCVGSDINTQSLDNVAAIIANNPSLKERFTLRRQHDKNHIFEGIIQAGEFFDVSVCNPPFHASEDEALKGSQRKLNNLARNRGEKATRSATLNFGGQAAELWCKGGEQAFLKKMIKESQAFSTQCRWFTSLVSKAENVKPATKLIRKLGAVDVREIEMKQGNKITRILAWTFI